MKQAIYRKQSVRGRAWNIQIMGDEKPVIGETVEVLKKHGGIDTVQITGISTDAPPWVCTFTNREWKSQGPTNPHPIAPPSTFKVEDFLNDDSNVEVQPNQDHTIQENNDMDQTAPVMPLQAPQNDLASAIGAAVAATANQAAERLEVRINAAIAELREQVKDIQARPTHTSITVKDCPTVTLEGYQHPMFEKVLRLTNAGLNVLLVGEAGCGKTFLAHQIAQALARKFGTLHCTAGMSESHISGWLLPTGNSGKFEYHPAEFVRMYEEGNGLFLLDEIDAADPNVLMFMNGALANGALHIPHRLQGVEVKRGDNLSIMAAANTYGHGANARYAGRNQLDGATLDRFYVVEMDYDQAREQAMFGKAFNNPAWKAAGEADSHELQELGGWVLNLRERVRQAQLRRIVSSRTLDKALTARKAGVSSREVKRDVLAGWTKDEIAKVGE